MLVSFTLPFRRCRTTIHNIHIQRCQLFQLGAGSLRQNHAKHLLGLPDFGCGVEGQVELTVRKFIAIFRTDLSFAASNGFCSGRMFVTLRALAYMIEADVQASERLNKTLTLFGERCPSGSLDLCSGRLGLKHFLGLGGYGVADKRRYKDVKDTARLLLQECLAGWPLIREVEQADDRFQHVGVRKDVPSLETAKKAGFFIDPVANPKMTPTRLWATTVNQKYSKFLGDQENDQVNGCKNGLMAVAFLQQGKSISEAQHIFLVCDRVRTTLHFVCFNRRNHDDTRFSLRTPMAILKSHDVFARFYKMLMGNDTEKTGRSRSQTTCSVIHCLANVTEESWFGFGRFGGYCPFNCG